MIQSAVCRSTVNDSLWPLGDETWVPTTLSWHRSQTLLGNIDHKCIFIATLHTSGICLLTWRWIQALRWESAPFNGFLKTSKRLKPQLWIDSRTKLAYHYIRALLRIWTSEMSKPLSVLAEKNVQSKLCRFFIQTVWTCFHTSAFSMGECYCIQH